MIYKNINVKTGHFKNWIFSEFIYCIILCLSFLLGYVLCMTYLSGAH